MLPSLSVEEAIMPMSTKSYTKTRFSADDAALVLIDHQSGIMQLVHDYSPAEFRNNVIGLAKLGEVFKLPTVLTTSLGQGPNGPLIPEVLSLFPDVPVIDLESSARGMIRSS
jgi:nicotinamidase-related amidase